MLSFSLVVSKFPLLCKNKFLMKTMSFTSIINGPFNWINGLRSNPVDSVGTYKNIEPRTGKVLGEVPISGEKEVHRAVQAAQNAFNNWSKMCGLDRGRCLIEAARIMRSKLEEIARIDVIDNGKPIWEAREDMVTVITCLEYFGGLAGSIAGQHVKFSGGSFAYVSREPLGVVGGIGAWNYPLQTCTWKVAPALACGNTFVYKPSEFTPITAVILGEVLKEAGLPDGVFNIVQGEAETGRLLSENPGCAKLSFTGSVATGTKVMQAGAIGGRNVTLELGGKSPLIIFDDANLKCAVKGALLANFLTQGQVCSNGTRIFVQRGIHDSFLEEFLRQTLKMKAGDPLKEDTTIGATINFKQAQKVLDYIKSAKDEGATVLCGGERIHFPDDSSLSDGYYLSPCILTNCRDEMKAVKDEIFGSVAAILPFETEEEVIKRANDTIYGLAGGVFTQDLARAHRVVDALNAGTVWINTYNLSPVEVPFGGFKQSGIGRENGLDAIALYTQSKTVYVETADDIDAGLLYQE